MRPGAGYLPTLALGRSRGCTTGPPSTDPAVATAGPTAGASRVTFHADASRSAPRQAYRIYSEEEFLAAEDWQVAAEPGRPARPGPTTRAEARGAASAGSRRWPPASRRWSQWWRSTGVAAIVAGRRFASRRIVRLRCLAKIDRRACRCTSRRSPAEIVVVDRAPRRRFALRPSAANRGRRPSVSAVARSRSPRTAQWPPITGAMHVSAPAATPVAAATAPTAAPSAATPATAAATAVTTATPTTAPSAATPTTAATTAVTTATPAAATASTPVAATTATAATPATRGAVAEFGFERR